MRKILLIATVLLGAFAVAQTAASKIGDTPSANNDWYNQKLATVVQMYDRVAAAAAPSTASPFESQRGTQPESMASNTGSQDDWYNQKLAAAIQQYSRDKAETAASTTFQ
jgi:hypothetical protein